MKKDIAYRFPTAPLASRFIAEVRSGTVGDCSCRRHSDDHEVLVTYSLSPSYQFDDRIQQLDDLAESLDGRESSA